MPTNQTSTLTTRDDDDDAEGGQPQAAQQAAAPTQRQAEKEDDDDDELSVPVELEDDTVLCRAFALSIPYIGSVDLEANEEWLEET